MEKEEAAHYKRMNPLENAAMQVTALPKMPEGIVREDSLQREA